MRMTVLNSGLPVSQGDGDKNEFVAEESAA